MNKAWMTGIVASALAACQPQTVDLGSSRSSGNNGPDGSATIPVGVDCWGGSCVMLASAHPSNIAVDATSVYWTNPVGGSNGVSVGYVMSVPITGGAPRTLASDQNFPFGIAVDSTNVYWTTLGDDGPGAPPGSIAGTVMRLPVVGGAQSQLVGNRLTGCQSVAVNGSGVYWTEDGGAVFGTPFGGGPVTTIGATEDKHGGIAVDAARVYWTDTTLGVVEAAPIAGGAAVTLADAQEQPYGIAVDPNNVYWTTLDSIVSVPLGGGTPTTIASGQAEPWYIEVDGSNVYWTTTQGGTLMRAPSVGGTPATLASNLEGPGSLAVDATSVYWAEMGLSQRIVKRTPK